MAKSFGECLKESSKAYFSGMWKGFKDSMKVMIPVSAGIIILGAVALKAAEDPDEDPDNEEAVPDEEPTKEEASSTDEADVCENLKDFEKKHLEEE